MDSLNTSIPFQILNYGCKVNTYDGGLLEKRLSGAGFLLRNEPKLYILNTCAVTAEATKEAVRTIRKIRMKSPDCVIVVTGCGAQVDTDKFQNLPGVDLIVANSHKGQIEYLVHEYLGGRLKERVFKSNIFKKSDLEEGGGLEEGHTRSFLKIQDGCNSFCTYCVIPFARGKSRSLTVDSLIHRTRQLVDEGVKEVVLTGVHIGDYEFGLEKLVEELLLKTKVERLRLTSLEPVEISDRLMNLFNDERLCPHFHMSIQSATTSILTRMKRQYDAQAVEDSLNQIARKQPNAFVGMDVIAGFPGEGEDEFLETYRRLERLPWTRLHVFPYSERPGTYAVRLDGQNDRAVVLRRADRLRELSQTRFQKIAREQIGRTKKVLVLKNNQGISRDYWAIKWNSQNFSTNQEVDLIPNGVEFASSGLFLTI